MAAPPVRGTNRSRARAFPASACVRALPVRPALFRPSSTQTRRPLMLGLIDRRQVGGRYAGSDRAAQAWEPLRQDELPLEPVVLAQSRAPGGHRGLRLGVCAG